MISTILICLSGIVIGFIIGYISQSKTLIYILWQIDKESRDARTRANPHASFTWHEGRLRLITRLGLRETELRLDNKRIKKGIAR